MVERGRGGVWWSGAEAGCGGAGPRRGVVERGGGGVGRGWAGLDGQGGWLWWGGECECGGGWG